MTRAVFCEEAIALLHIHLEDSQRQLPSERNWAKQGLGDPAKLQRQIDDIQGAIDILNRYPLIPASDDADTGLPENAY